MSGVFDFSEPADGQFLALRETFIGAVRLSYGVQASSKGGGVKLYSLRTPVRHRRLGLARTAMMQFLIESDRAGKAVSLYSSPLDEKTNPNKLTAFYDSLGFKLMGRRVNAAGDPEMRRDPLPLYPASKRSAGLSM